MRWTPVRVGCLLWGVATGCYEAPSTTGEQSYVLPTTGGGSTTGNNNATTGGAGTSTSGTGTQQVNLGGSVSGLASNASVVLSGGGSQVTLTRNGAFTFPGTVGVGLAYSIAVVTQPVGQQCQVLDAQGVATSDGVSVPIVCNVYLRFAAGQSARNVIGQNDFTDYARNFNQTGPAANSTSNPWGNSYTSDTGVVYLPDSLNARVLGYDALPSDNGHAADFVVGQSDFVSVTVASTASQFNYIAGVATDHRGGLLVTDMPNNRVMMYAQEFTSSGVGIDGVIGQSSLDGNTAGCSATQLNTPLAAATDGNILVVADSKNFRVLLWPTLPDAHSMGTAATTVLGQPNLSTCGVPTSTTSQSLNKPQGVWTDGQMLAVVALSDNRILIWKNITSLAQNGNNNAPADVVLGQASFTTNAAASGPTGLSAPQYITSDGSQLIVTDTGNNRVLLYNTLSPATGQQAIGVLGQTDFNGTAAGGGAAGMSGPDGLGVSGRSLIVGEGPNNRFLIFDSH